MLGLIALKDERLREAYATDEIDLVRGLAGQIVLSLTHLSIPITLPLFFNLSSGLLH